MSERRIGVSKTEEGKVDVPQVEKKDRRSKDDRQDDTIQDDDEEKVKE